MPLLSETLRRFGASLASHVKHGDRADRRCCPAAPLHRQADEGELAAAKQCFEIAQALDMGDVEVEAGLVDEGIHLALRSRPHRIDAEMDDALLRQPFGGGNVYAGIGAGIFLSGGGWLMGVGGGKHGGAV